MTLSEVTGPPGPPWERTLAGQLDVLTVESEVLAGNPLGDPARRPLFVYLPPELPSEPVPSVYLLTYYSGTVDNWTSRGLWEPSLIERVDELFQDEDVPRAVVVFADGSARFGCSQWIDSPGTGDYMSYLCDEVVPFIDDRYPTVPDPDRRGVTGHSSGGYGSLMVSMLRPGVFGGLASHAADSLFEACYGRDFAPTVKQLRDRHEGSLKGLLERFENSDHFEWGDFQPALEIYQMALCYSPDPAEAIGAALPFDLETGEVIDEVFARWLSWDPVRAVHEHLDDLRSLRCIYLEAGKGDEYFLDLGATSISRTLGAAGIDHRFELFDGRHGGIKHRYPRAIHTLVEALAG